MNTARSFPYLTAAANLLILGAFGCARMDEAGKVIFSEKTKDRYLVLREGRSGYVHSGGTTAADRPELGGLREVHGNLKFICTEIHGLDRPRIVVETKNTSHYQVVYKWQDYGALHSIAKQLGLIATEEEREIPCAIIGISEGGHRLVPALPGKLFVRENLVCGEDGSWPLDGVTLDNLAQFLESYLREPVVNKTGLNGRWNVRLSADATKNLPMPNRDVVFHDLGLELRWGTAKVLVTLIKDAEPK